MVLLAVAAMVVSVSVASAADEQAVKDQVAAFAAAWDKHDAAALASLRTEDGTLINPGGVVAKGRAEITKLLTREHATMFKGTTYKVADVTVQAVSDDVVVADVNATITGIKTPDGAAAPDYNHHVVWVMVKKDGKWLGAVARPYQFAGMKK
jgi:uncharacterized protein (TIGR02246 family)